jgi:hypothetical protein
MKYQRPAFTVPANTAKVDPATCEHKWVREQDRRCVFCGSHVPPVYPPPPRPEAA